MKWQANGDGFGVYTCNLIIVNISQFLLKIVFLETGIEKNCVVYWIGCSNQTYPPVLLPIIGTHEVQSCGISSEKN